MNREELIKILHATETPDKIAKWLREQYFPEIMNRYNSEASRKRFGLYRNEQIPSNERNLTDVRTRMGVLIEFELARISNEILPELGIDDVFWSYVVANRFPDLEIRENNGNRLLRLEIKCLQCVAEEKSANFDTLIKDINPNTDFVIVCLWDWDNKGIGGTSTDAECSQVAKHRRRREKEHRDKEILPIYIVNHQRYIRPSLRQNPPFSDNQIDYAKNDERGLLTTWQLYNQYKLIENGIFTKKETRESLDKWGLISLLPKNLIRVGIYKEYFKKPKAGILTLNNVKLEVGKMIYAKKDGKWICTSIVSIQLNDKDVDQVDNGEVGIVTDIELEKGYEIFVKIE